MKYEVDLRERESGNSVCTILSTPDLDAAYDFMDAWNRKHLPDYNYDYAGDDYIDGSDGLVADVYHVD